MAGFLQDKAAEMMADAMRQFDIEPGELLERIEHTMDLIDTILPIIEQMADISKSLEGNVNNLQNEIGNFNENTEDMVEAMEGLDDTLNKFHGLFSEIEEEQE